MTAEGDPDTAKLLAEALQLSTNADEDAGRILTHGFHSYPARLHPLTARRLLEGTPRGARLLDPFVGSGTSLVEGLRLGLEGLGTDLNPLAILLTRWKARVLPAPRRAALVATARAVGEASLERVKTRTRTKTSGSEYDDPQAYAPHVFRELVGLREELDGVADRELREGLALVLSSIVLKVSRQRADTSEAVVERAIGKGNPTRLFVRKAEELAARLEALAAEVPAGTPPVDVRQADARKLTHVPDQSVDLVLTSPPYLGTYDYAAQHRRRLKWLRLDARGFERDEIGARRRAQQPREALTRWQQDVNAFVAAIARVLVVGGRAYVVIGDSAVGREMVVGDAALREAAARVGLLVVAHAAQARPNFYAGVARPTRSEHLLCLRRR